MSSYTPLVSIVIPVYNGADYVAQAIESALAQTYENTEILVVNDGSPDNSEEVIRPYLDRVRYFKKPNGGVSTALNCAIREMKGNWLSWLSHDDLYLPQKIERQVRRLNALLEEKPGCEIERYVLSCQSQRIDENGKLLPHRGTRHPVYADPWELAAKELIHYTIGGCTVLAAKSAYEEMGGFDEANRTVSDAAMWFKLMRSGYHFDFSDEVLVQSRYHKGMVSVRRSELVSRERRAFYSKTVQEILPHVEEETRRQLALAMTRANMDEAAALAASACADTDIGFFCRVQYAKLYRRLRGLARELYRTARWR